MERLGQLYRAIDPRVFEEYEVSGLLGEAKVLQLVEGTSEVQRMIIARELVAESQYYLRE